jgi:hypothetical protein
MQWSESLCGHRDRFPDKPDIHAAGIVTNGAGLHVRHPVGRCLGRAGLRRQKLRDHCVEVE